jgi:hypothetical protein
MGMYLDLHDVAYDHPVAMEELAEYREMEKVLGYLAILLKCKPLEVYERARVLLDHIKSLEAEKDRLTNLLKEGGKNNQ